MLWPEAPSRVRAEAERQTGQRMARSWPDGNGMRSNGASPSPCPSFRDLVLDVVAVEHATAGVHARHTLPHLGFLVATRHSAPSAGARSSRHGARPDQSSKNEAILAVDLYNRSGRVSLWKASRTGTIVVVSALCPSKRWVSSGIWTGRRADRRELRIDAVFLAHPDLPQSLIRGGVVLVGDLEMQCGDVIPRWPGVVCCASERQLGLLRQVCLIWAQGTPPVVRCFRLEVPFHSALGDAFKGQYAGVRAGRHRYVVVKSWASCHSRRHPGEVGRGEPHRPLRPGRDSGRPGLAGPRRGDLDARHDRAVRLYALSPPCLYT
jgi:hypothetical protein